MPILEQPKLADLNVAVEVVLCSNGPGEVYTWAKPMLAALKTLKGDLRVVLVLLPCPFASGREAEIAREFGFDAVLTANEYLLFAAGGSIPSAFQSDHGLVLQLGGDAMHAVRIGKRLRYPVWRYSFESYWRDDLERLFVHDERTRQKAVLKAPAERVEVIGNLVADAINDETPAPKSSRLEVVLLPGSRHFEVIHMLPLFAAAVDQIAARVPEVGFSWLRSNLLSDETLELAYSAVKVLDLDGVPVRLEGDHLVTPSGVRIRMIESDRRNVMKSADLALTIPGTNTLELGIAGVPSIISLPLQKPELIPIEGPLQYISMIPIVGPWLKRRAAIAVLSKYKFVSLPNIIAQELIQPELRGDVTPDWIAREAMQLLLDSQRRSSIRSRLQALMPKPGAAHALAQRVLERLEDRTPKVTA
jgi:hypothetical protein